MALITENANELQQPPPQLTVIMPVYNGMPFIQEAIGSILKQSFRDFALIVVNGDSQDGTSEYLDSIDDARVRVISQIAGRQGAARNAGLQQCRSKYVAFMDADDISLPKRFQLQIEYLDRHPDVVILGTQIEIVIGSTIQRAFTVPVDHDGIERRFMKGQAGLCNSSIMFRYSSAIACGGYPEREVGEDTEFCLRMLEQGRAANLSPVLVRYRLHPSQSTMKKSKQAVIANHFAVECFICRETGLSEPVFDEYVDKASFLTRLTWSAEARALIEYRNARINIATGRRAVGIVQMAIAALCRPGTTLRHILRIAGAL